MDDLLKIANSVMESFNPDIDNADDFEPIPDGVYNCLLEEVTNKSNEKGTKWLTFRFSILDGNNVNRFLYVNYFFTEKMQVSSIKKLIKLAHDFEYELPLEAFTDMDTLCETLKSLEGINAIVDKSTTKTGYVNYSVTRGD